MDDRTLLEFAAKAFGLDWRDWTRDAGALSRWPWLNWPYEWNPLANNDDAFQIMIALQLAIRFYAGSAIVSIPGRAGFSSCAVMGRDGDNLAAAVRRAVVRTAAEIGMVMP